MSIAASGYGFTFSEDEGAVGLPRVLCASWGPLEQVSRHTVVTTDASSTGWGATCNGQAASGLLLSYSYGAPTALAHQLCRAVDSASSLMAVPATAVGKAHASPHGQHCGCLVHQPVGRYTITPHVTARPPSPSLESHAVQVTAQSCGRCALVDLFASHESSHCQRYFSLTEGPLGTDALAHSWPQALCKYVFPPVSLLAPALCKLRVLLVLLVAPHWPSRTCWAYFPSSLWICLSTASSSSPTECSSNVSSPALKDRHKSAIKASNSETMVNVCVCVCVCVFVFV